MSTRAEDVARAVLYEGYILYPYRPSSVKNQQRWNFGVVYPEGSGEGSSRMQTQCLAMADSKAAQLDVKIGFLQLAARTIRELDETVLDLFDGNEPASHPVQKIECGGSTYQSWEEGVEREIVLHGCRLDALDRCPVNHEFLLPASRAVEAVRNESGQIALLIVREQQAISGVVAVSGERIRNDLLRITIGLNNRTCHQPQPRSASPVRESALLRSLVSAHKILTVRGGEFVSLLDPPEAYIEAAAQCENIGAWPVMAGEDGQRDVMLSSPIILYDYPQIAPESAGDCDGTEIDEILSLRILTLTDEEKREMRQSDERGRRILERTEALPEEQWLKLHGVLRGLRPPSEVN